MRTLILYLTNNGQTKKIAEHIGSQLSDQQVTIASLKNLTLSLQDFDQIIIGASVRYGHFKPALEQFINQHYAVLQQKKSGLFTVNLTARKEAKNQPHTNVYTRKLLQRIKWQPNHAAVFAGALYYPRYKWYERAVIRFIMKMTGGETDISKEVEYTNWQKVEQFAQNFSVNEQ